MLRYLQVQCQDHVAEKGLNRYMFLTLEKGDNILQIFPNEFTLTFFSYTTPLSHGSSTSFGALYIQ